MGMTIVESKVQFFPLGEKIITQKDGTSKTIMSFARIGTMTELSNGYKIRKSHKSETWSVEHPPQPMTNKMGIVKDIFGKPVMKKPLKTGTMSDTEFKLNYPGLYDIGVKGHQLALELEEQKRMGL